MWSGRIRSLLLSRSLARGPSDRANATDETEPAIGPIGKAQARTTRTTGGAGRSGVDECLSLIHCHRVTQIENEDWRTACHARGRAISKAIRFVCYIM
ncbi:hypothetical protein VTI74DRAFT_2291 [Chaetomium olivicolor]